MRDRLPTSSWILTPLLACLVSVVGCGSEDEPSTGTAGSTAQGGSSSGVASGGMSGSTGNSGGASGSGGAAGGASAGATTGGVSSGGSAAGAGGGTSGGTNGGAATGGQGGTGGAGGAGGGAGGSGGSSSTAFALTSPSWMSQPSCAASDKAGCGIFPKENIGTDIGGDNKSPELSWTAGPDGTQSYAIVMQDLSFMMMGKPFVHWVMWNIPGASRMLPAGLETTAMPSVPAGSSQRSFNGNGFQGSGACGNVYEFILYALPMATLTPTGTSQTAVADALAATSAPTASLRARSGAPGCME